jgi:outer membrane lipoprotein-sorting protein
MKRFFTLIGCMAALAASCAIAADLTAAQIVDQNVAARGGLEAWRAVKTMTMAGEMDAGGKQDVRLPFVMSLKRPNKSRLEIRFQDKTALQVYDGSLGWKYRPFLNREDVEPFTADEAKLAAAAAELDGRLVDYAAKGTKVELAGMEAVEGKSAYKLRLTPKVGSPLNLWVDAQSFLEVKSDGEPRRIDGRTHKVAVMYRDYKTVSGLKIAHTLETVVEGVQPARKISVNTVTLNPRLEDSMFAKPRPAGAASAAVVTGKTPAL